MNRKASKYADHPRLTWFGNGSVAYVDYVSCTESWFIVDDLSNGGFQVRPPDVAGQCSPPIEGFKTFDDAVEYALTQAGAEPWSSLGRWVDDFRFEFDPPIQLPENGRPTVVTAFDLTPVSKVPGVREQRGRLLQEFIWDTLLNISHNRT